MWDKLLSSALIGTANHPVKISTDDTPLGDLLNRINTENAEQQLLTAAAAIHLHHKAGQTVVRSFEGQLPDQCNKETYPPAHPESIGHLETILNGQTKSRLVNDWIYGAEAAHVRIPHHLVAQFMDFIQKSGESDFHPAVSQLIGERGHWLAQHQRKWAFLSWQHDFTQAWQHSGTRIRQMIFRQLRMANPELARTFFIEKILRLKNAAPYIDEMVLMLSLDDEPLFEMLLDNENEAIRQSASDCLRHMTDAHYITRMIARMRGRLMIGKDGDGNPALLIDLPTVLDETMKRDTINRQAPDGMNEQEGWFFFMLTCVPPAYWCEQLRQTPDDLILLGSGQKNMFIHAWVRAAHYHRDEAWARALITYLINNEETHLLSWLTPMLPAEEQEQIALEVWRHSHNGIYMNGMLAGNHWSHSLSNEILKLYHNALEKDPDGTLRWMQHGLINHVYRLHPDTQLGLHQLLIPYLENAKSHTEQAILEALNVFKMRQSIQISFTTQIK